MKSDRLIRLLLLQMNFIYEIQTNLLHFEIFKFQNFEIFWSVQIRIFTVVRPGPNSFLSPKSRLPRCTYKISRS